MADSKQLLSDIKKIINDVPIRYKQLNNILAKLKQSDIDTELKNIDDGLMSYCKGMIMFINKQYAESLIYFMKSSDLGNHIAMYMVGRFYDEGFDHVVENSKIATDWFNKSYVLNGGPATLKIAETYKNSDYDKYIEYLKKAYNDKDIDVKYIAAYRLGMAFYSVYGDISRGFDIDLKDWAKLNNVDENTCVKLSNEYLLNGNMNCFDTLMRISENYFKLKHYDNAITFTYMALLRLGYMVVLDDYDYIEDDTCIINTETFWEYNKYTDKLYDYILNNIGKLIKHMDKINLIHICVAYDKNLVNKSNIESNKGRIDVLSFNSKLNTDKIKLDVEGIRLTVDKITNVIKTYAELTLMTHLNTDTIRAIEGDITKIVTYINKHK